MKTVYALLLSCCSLHTLASADPEPGSAEFIYNGTCVVCHGKGVEGAPRPGVPSDWSPRLAYGVEELYISTIEGIGTAMPPRGMCADCTDQELKAVVDFMIGAENFN